MSSHNKFIEKPIILIIVILIWLPIVYIIHHINVCSSPVNMHITNHYDVVHGCIILVYVIGKHEKKIFFSCEIVSKKNLENSLVNFIFLIIP